MMLGCLGSKPRHLRLVTSGDEVKVPVEPRLLRYNGEMKRSYQPSISNQLRLGDLGVESAVVRLLAADNGEWQPEQGNSASIHVTIK